MARYQALQDRHRLTAHAAARLHCRFRRAGKGVAPRNAWAAGAGVGFSEAVRRLCAKALTEWPDAAGAVVDEVRCVEWRLSAALARLESQHSDLLAAVEGADDEEQDPDRYYAYYGGIDAEDDESAGDDPDEDEPEWGGGFDAEEFDREFDEWWEAKKNEWN